LTVQTIFIMASAHQSSKRYHLIDKESDIDQSFNNVTFSF